MSKRTEHDIHDGPDEVLLVGCHDGSMRELFFGYYRACYE
jgi:hypothetical protein